MERAKREEFKRYRVDEFMVKFLGPGRRGVNIVVQMRRKTRRPKTLSLYEIPIFECNMSDFEENFEHCAVELMKTIIEHSENVKKLAYDEKYGGQRKVLGSGEETYGVEEEEDIHNR